MRMLRIWACILSVQYIRIYKVPVRVIMSLQINAPAVCMVYMHKLHIRVPPRVLHFSAIHCLVCLSVCYRSSGYSIRLYLQPTTSTGFS